VSDVDALMLARIPPADLLNMERNEIRRRTKDQGKIEPEIKDPARVATTVGGGFQR